MENNTENNNIADLPDLADLDLPDLPDLSDFPEFSDESDASSKPVNASGSINKTETKANTDGDLDFNLFPLKDKKAEPIKPEPTKSVNNTDLLAKPNPIPDSTKKANAAPVITKKTSPTPESAKKAESQAKPNLTPDTAKKAESQAKLNPSPNTAKKAESQSKPNLTPDTAKKADSQSKANPAPDTSKKAESQPKPNPASDTAKNTDSQQKTNPTPDSVKKAESQSKPNTTSDSAKKSNSVIPNKSKTLPNKTKAWTKTPAKKQYKTPTYNKPKKKKKFSCLKFLFILFSLVVSIAAIVGYVGYKGYDSFVLIDKTKNLILETPDEIKAKYTALMDLKYDDDNFPLYAKNFIPNEKLFEEISRIDTLVPRGKDLGNHFMEEKLSESIKSIIPQNIGDFRTQFAASIKQKMTEAKKKASPTYEESSDLPSSPDKTTFRNTVRYWNLLSRYYDNKRDYDTSLLMIHSVFYLTKDMLTNYSSSGFISSRLISFINYSIACDSLLSWANKAKLNSHKLSKAVAKDILDFVDNEESFSKIIIFCEKSNEEHMKLIFKYFEDGKLAAVEDTDEYKELIDFLYKKPIEFMDKPLYEMQKDLDEMENKITESSLKYDVT
ncbi:MAG: hypothetical protein J6Z11_00165 [Candidatus Riflebacteria bacterium]|nr:hypothetical protein [Candidatus Riflebacteria bacterium]